MMIESAQKIMKRISQHGEIYIVGGAVRDHIMGKPMNDVDMATNVPIVIIESMFPSHDIGKNKDFGIVVVEQDGYFFEIAQFRADMYDSISGKGASSVAIVNDLKADVDRRDFTINGIAMDVEGNIIDHVGGIDDIENGIIRAIGEPAMRFAEDYIRMLRAVRFSVRTGFSIDHMTKEAIKANAHHIAEVPPERVMKEIYRMAEHKGDMFADAIIMLREVGLLKYIFPEIDAMSALPHTATHHPEGGVFDHTMAALRQYDGIDITTNMAILFHDIGKVNTFSEDETGIHYFNHSTEGAPMTDALADRMKMDNDMRGAIKYAATMHMKFHFPMKDKKWVALMDSPYWNVLKDVSFCDTSSRLHAYNPDEWAKTVEIFTRVQERYGSENPMSVLKKVVRGDMVMAIRGITKPSKEVGEIIKKCIDSIISQKIDFRDEAAVEKIIRSV